MIIPLEIAKELKNLSDEFENLNDRDRLRYFIQESLMQEYSSNLKIVQKESKWRSFQPG